jgi:hypothetical protein
MKLENERWPGVESEITQLLAKAVSRTGFTPSDIDALVESELEMSHLLDYVDAVLSHRMN